MNDERKTIEVDEELWRQKRRAIIRLQNVNGQLVDALDKLHAVVIAKNRAGADWGEQFTDLMVALSLAQSAINAAKSGDV